MPRPTQQQCDRISASAREKFGDVWPEGEGLTPEKAEHIEVLTKILIELEESAARGALAAALLEIYGKAAPVIARRMVEVYPRK
jgi:hypothetical protein